MSGYEKMTTLIKHVVAQYNQPTVVIYDPADPKQAKAFLELLLDFYGVETADDEVQKRLQSPNVKLLKVRNEYKAFLIYKLLDEGSKVHITNFGVHSDARKKGYGETLLKAFIAECRVHPEHKRIGLAVRANNIPAKALYKKLGFKVIKHGKEGSIDFEVMELTL